MNYEILKLELQDAAYAAMTDAEAAQALNALVVDAKQSISSHDIRKYLMLVDKLLPIESSVLESATAATRALEIFPAFDMTESAVETKLIAVLDALITDSLIDATDKAAILSLGDKLISRAELLGLPDVGVWHVEMARG
jgi:hypothetical protein